MKSDLNTVFMMTYLFIGWGSTLKSAVTQSAAITFVFTTDKNRNTIGSNKTKTQNKRNQKFSQVTVTCHWTMSNEWTKETNMIIHIHNFNCLRNRNLHATYMMECYDKTWLLLFPKEKSSSKKSHHYHIKYMKTFKVFLLFPSETWPIHKK